MKNHLARLTALVLSLCAWAMSSSNHVYSQSTTPHPQISQLWGNPADGIDEFPNKMILSTDGNFIIAGFWQDSAWVKKVSACGSTIWDKRFQVGTWTSLNGIAELPNGNLAAAGVCKNCAVGDTAKKVYVALMDGVGSLLTDTTLGNLNLDAEARDIVRMLNGNIAITGSVVVGTFLAPTDELVAIFNPNLGLLRYLLHDWTYYDDGAHMIATQDGGLAIAGSNHDHLFDTTYATVLKCNAMGDTVWMSKETTIETWFTSLAEGSNGDLVAVGKARIDTVTIFDGYLRAINGSNGQLGTRQFYGSPGWFDELMDIHAVADGYLVGGRYDHPATSGYGARDMIFHLSPGLAQSDLTYNDDYVASYALTSLVPLSPKGEDWATVSRSEFYSSNRVRFLKHHRQGKDFRFTAFPQDYQLYPQDNLGFGTVQIVGIDSTTGIQYDSIRVDFLRNDTLITSTFQALSYNSGVASVNQSIPIPAMLAEFSYRLYGVESGISYPEAEACAVVAGDAFVVTGTLGGFYETLDSSLIDHANPFVRSYGRKFQNDTVYAWHRERDDANPLADNRSGEVGMLLGDRIVTERQVPVAILNGGNWIGEIDSMLPGTVGDDFGKFRARAIKSGLRDHLKAFIYEFGEADTYDTLGYVADSLESFVAKYKTLRCAWDTTYPNRIHDFVFQMRQPLYPGISWLSSLELAEGQRMIQDSFPNTTVLSTTGLDHDSLRFTFTDGFERGVDDLYRVLDQKVYGAPAVNNTLPPNLDSAKFNSNRTEVILHLRNTNDAFTWDSGMESDFILHGAGNDTVDFGYANGNEIHLVLSGQVPLNARISYNSHVFGAESSVKNANGLGMLRFYNQPIEPFVVIGNTPQMLTSLRLTAFPNPTANTHTQVAISTQRPGDIHLRLLGLDGICIRSWDVSQSNDLEVHGIELSVGSGVYLLQATQEDGSQSFVRLVKL